MIYVVELSFPTQSRSPPKLIKRQSWKQMLPALFFCVPAYKHKLQLGFIASDDDAV